MLGARCGQSQKIRIVCDEYPPVHLGERQLVCVVCAQ